MFDMIHLAVATDSTRAATFKTFGDHHDLSHHGKEPAKLAACRHVEVDLMKSLGAPLGKFKGATEGLGATPLARPWCW